MFVEQYPKLHKVFHPYAIIKNELTIWAGVIVFLKEFGHLIFFAICWVLTDYLLQV